MRHVYYIKDYRIDWTPDGSRCDVSVRGEWKATFVDPEWNGDVPSYVVDHALRVRP